MLYERMHPVNVSEGVDRNVIHFMVVGGKAEIFAELEEIGQDFCGNRQEH